MAKPREISVKVQCVLCRGQRQIRAGEVKPGDHPMCEKCLMPMVPVEARSG